MGRKVALAVSVVTIAILSAGLAGGQVGGGFLWWGSHEPIYIYGDADFTFANGVLSGTGTEADPYVIEGWRVEAPNADYGIYVDHTTRYFVVRNCVMERARIAGVYLNSVHNARIQFCQISLSDTAICFLNSKGNEIRGCAVSECQYGVVMAADSRDNVVAGNSFFENGISGSDPERWNQWYDEKGGNYWSDYKGQDKNNDGFGDEPYYPLWDAKPLMTSPVERTEVRTAGPSYAGNLVAPDGSLVVTSQTPITLQSKDPGSGLAEIKYSIDGGEWTTYAGPIFLTGDDGPRKVAYYGIDHLGNAEPKKMAPFLLDNHTPKTVLDIGDPKHKDERGTWVTSATPLSLRRTQESTYGRTQTYYRIDGGNWHVYSSPFTLAMSDGAHEMSFYSKNASGVAEAIQTIVLYKDDAPPSTRGSQSAPTSSVGVTVGATMPTTKPVVATAPMPAAPAQTASTTTHPAEPQTPSSTEF
ncbi:MAG: right-handed parallel beta-helix repeat-containing protein [Candidatus Bipolaricaulota bacterium]|nr:right-handed parallel beta-helix repeat-containing protein [Candidatus Bipolaricaulota bacterium]